MPPPFLDSTSLSPSTLHASNMCRGALSIWPRTRAMRVLGGGPKGGTRKTTSQNQTTNVCIKPKLFDLHGFGASLGALDINIYIYILYIWEPKQQQLSEKQNGQNIISRAKYQSHTVHFQLVTSCYIIRDARRRTETIRQPFQDTTSIPSLEGEEYVIAVLLEQLSWWWQCVTRSKLLPTKTKTSI